MFRHVFLFLTCNVFFCPGSLSAFTSVVIIWKPDRVVVAADSLSADEYGRKRLNCKVRQIGKVFVTAAGMTAYKPTGYNISTEASESFLPSFTDFSDAYSQFIWNVEMMYNQSRNFLRLKNPEAFERLAARSLDTAVIYGDGALVRLEADWKRWSTVTPPGGRPYSMGEGAPHKSLPPADGAGITAEAVMLGLRDQAFAYLKKKAQFDGEEPIDLARRLVEMEIRANPDEAGPPISILVITPKAAYWAEGAQGLCDEISKP